MAATKTKNNHEPVEAAAEADAPALRAAERVLAKYQPFASALMETGVAIPRLLKAERELTAQLARAEISGDGADEAARRLAAVSSEREAAARKRKSASDEVLEMATDLAEVRAAVAQAQAALAAGYAKDFAQRWQDCCDQLARLRSEAGALSRALGAVVPTPPPYVAALSLMGVPEVRPATLSPLPAPPPLPSGLAGMAALLEKLDAAAALVSGIRQGADIHAKYAALARIRSEQPVQLSGAFQAVKQFDYLGQRIEPGALIDETFMPPGMIVRFWKGRCLQSLDGQSANAA